MTVFLASSAANEENTDVIICWDREEAVSLSAISAAMAAVDFLGSGGGVDRGSGGSLFNRRHMLAASSIWT